MACLPVATPADVCCETCPEATVEQTAAAIIEAERLLAALIGIPDLGLWRRCQWVWRPCSPLCGCPNLCGCGPSQTLRVPWAQLTPDDIDAVLVDGTPVVPTPRFRIARDGSSSNTVRLSPVDTGTGMFTFPAEQNLDRWHSQPGTWGIRLWLGWTPPQVRLAVADLACELLRRCKESCGDLPWNVESVTEAGVTMRLDPNRPRSAAVAQVLEMFRQGETVVWSALSDNPGGVWERADV